MPVRLAPRPGHADAYPFVTSILVAFVPFLFLKSSTNLASSRPPDQKLDKEMPGGSGSYKRHVERCRLKCIPAFRTRRSVSFRRYSCSFPVCP